MSIDDVIETSNRVSDLFKVMVVLHERRHVGIVEKENSLQIPINMGIRGRIFGDKIRSVFGKKVIMADKCGEKFPVIAGQA